MPLLLGIVADSYKPPAWTPALLPGLAAWWDAADTSTITHTAGAVSQWNDRSPNARHVTSAGTYRPTTGAATLNGLNVLTFNGANLLDTAASTTLTQPFTVLAVAAITGSTGRLLCHRTAPDVQYLIGVVPSRTAIYAGVDFVGTGAAPVTGTFYAIGAVGKGATSYAISNATKGTPGNAGTLALGLGRIGARNDTNLGLAGRVAEIAVCAGEITQTDLDKWNAYAHTKWGLTT